MRNGASRVRHAAAQPRRFTTTQFLRRHAFKNKHTTCLCTAAAGSDSLGSQLPRTSRSMSNLDHNAVLRGAQLTIVGAYRALQNPKLFESKHYRQAFTAVIAGLVIRIALWFPVMGVRVLLSFVGLFVDLHSAQWDDSIIEGLDFIQKSVLQLPFFLMSAMRYLTPTLDEMFMKSLEWVDHTYLAKHASEDPSTLRALYYPNLKMYTAAAVPGVNQKTAKNPYEAVLAFLIRSSRKAAISIAVYLLSFTPYIGRFVLPAASFYSLHQVLGGAPAATVFGLGLFVPKRWMVMLIQGFFASRSLMRGLLEPYFSRVKYTKEQKKLWFRDREAVLFGFGVGFYFLIKTPLLGVLIYGIAEASTAYLITKITEPPPPPAERAEFAEKSLRWTNKHEFLRLDLGHLDKLNVTTKEELEKPTVSSENGRKDL